MKILVLGNSNSILKDGWFSFFKQLIVREETGTSFEFMNLSIGGSPSPALLCQCLMNEEKILSFDLVIIEPTVIDHGEEWQNSQEILVHARCLLDFFEKKSIKTILLLLPRNAAGYRLPRKVF